MKPWFVIDRTRPAIPPKTALLSEHDLFRMRLEAMFDGRHELVRLAKLIDRKRFDDAFGSLYDQERGRPAVPTRLMAALLLLKHIKALSDEQVCAQWVETPYFPASRRGEFFRHELPLDRSSMKLRRGRIVPGNLEALLAETIAVATKAAAVSLLASPGGCSLPLVMCQSDVTTRASLIRQNAQTKPKWDRGQSRVQTEVMSSSGWTVGRGLLGRLVDLLNRQQHGHFASDGT